LILDRFPEGNSDEFGNSGHVCVCVNVFELLWLRGAYQFYRKSISIFFIENIEILKYINNIKKKATWSS
jgi:hypothetical protein